MVPEAIPLAMAAGFFPAGLAAVVWYLSRPGGFRLAAVYAAGAAAATLGSGVALLAVLGSGRVVPDTAPSVMAVAELAVGAVVLAASLWVVLAAPDGAGPRPPRGTSYLGAFGLGLAMWTPSIAYVLAVEAIAAARLHPPARALNLVVIDAIILAMAWGPLLAYRAAPETANRLFARLACWLQARTRPLTAVIGGLGGTYLLGRGIHDLA